jgi:tape measure domain-containing protein
VDIAELGLVVRSDGVVIAGKRLKDFKKEASETDKAVGLLNATFTKLAGLAGVVAGSFLVKGLIEFSSAWSDLKGRVDLATGSMGHADEVMTRLESIARRTYSAFGSTAEVYLSNANALKDLGLSTSQALDYTESLNNAMVVSGAKAQQAVSVQNALSKAMGLGKLSGENLNTILASGGRIAQLLAEELGTTTLGLRKMGEDGKITSDVIQRTLLGNLERLREEADSMAATAQDGFNLLGNAVFAFVGRVDQAIGAGEGLGAMLVGIADAITASTEPAIAGIMILIDNIPRLTAYASAFAVVWGTQYVAAMVASATVTGLLSAALGVLRTAMIRTGIGALIVILGEVVYQLWNVVDGSKDVSEAFTRLGNSGRQTWERISDGANWIGNLLQGIALNISAAFTKAWADIMNGFIGTMNAIKSGWNAVAGIMGAPLITASFENEVLKKYMDSITMKADAIDAFARADSAYNRMVADKSGMTTDMGEMPAFGDINTMLGERPGLGAPGVSPTDLGGGETAKLNAYQEATKAIREQTEALGWEADAIRMSDMEASKFSKTMELLKAAKEAGIPITSSLIDEINGLANAYATASERSRIMERDLQMINELNSAVASGFADVFTSILDGSKTAGEAIGDLLSQLGKLLINQAFNMLFNVGGGGGGLLGSLLSFDGGGETPKGPRTGGVDGKGGFLSILHPDETVIDNTRGGASNDNGRAGNLTIQINGSGLSQAQLTAAIADALSNYDSGLARKVEGKVHTMINDPRAADGSW